MCPFTDVYFFILSLPPIDIRTEASPRWSPPHLHLHLLYDGPVLLRGHPLPELPSDIPPASLPRKAILTPGKWRPGLPTAWCLTSLLDMKKNALNVYLKVGGVRVWACVCVMRRQGAKKQEGGERWRVLGYRRWKRRRNRWHTTRADRSQKSRTGCGPAGRRSLMGKRTTLMFWLQEADYFCELFFIFFL